MSHDVTDANDRARTRRAEQSTAAGRKLASQHRESHFDQQVARSPREQRIDLIDDALLDAGARQLWSEGSQRQRLTGWGLNGHLLIVVDRPHGIDVMQSLAPGVNSLDAILDVIKRHSNPGTKTLRNEAQHVVEAFDEVDWERIGINREDLIEDGGKALNESLLNLVCLLGASNRLREACGITRPPFASQHDKVES